MNYKMLKTLLCSLLITILLPLGAQEDDSPGCDLPAPSTLTTTLLGPDVVDAIWSAVPGANGYDVLLIDLSNNQILYSNTHFGTQALITGHIITADMIVAVGPICDNGEIGGYIIDDPEGIHVEELVVQMSEDPAGPSKTYNCLSDNESVYENHHSVTNNSTTISLQPQGGSTRQRLVTFINIHEYASAPNSSNAAYSLVEVAPDATGNSYTIGFPSRLGVKKPIANTLPRLPMVNNTINVEYNGNDFYELVLNPFAREVDITFDPLFENPQVTSLHCFEGRNASSGNYGLVGQLPDFNGMIPQDRTEAKVEDFNFYPNPAGSQITVLTPKDTKLRILDLSGRVVLHQQLFSGSQQMDVSRLLPGTYLLQYFDGQDYQTERLIKL